MFEKEIRKCAKEIKDGDWKKVEDIAVISTNNDKKIGALIREIFEKVGRYAHINIENGKFEDRYEITSGVEVKRPYIDYIFVNQEDKKTCLLEEPYVFMVNSMLTEDDAELVADLMGTVCLQKNRPLVVVAKGYDASIRSLFYANKQIKKDLPILAIDIAIQGKENLEKFDDLAISLGAVPYDKLGGEVLEKFDHNRLGSCAKVVSTDISTKFIEGHGNPKSIEARINYIKERLEELELLDDHIDHDDEIRDLKKRIASLSQSMAIIYVGGETQTERDTKKFLIEDAVYAVKSALEYGKLS